MAEILFQVYEKEEWVTKEVVQLTLFSYRIGRSPRCEIHLSWWHSPTLSSVQATLSRQPSGKYNLFDGEANRRSTNGCFLKGERITQELQLNDQDIIQLAPGLQMIYSDRPAKKELLVTEAISGNKVEVFIVVTPETP